MTQCRQGWHLEDEPVTHRAAPTQEHTELMATRADLLAVYAECKAIGDEITCEQIADSITELDTELRAAGVRGRLAPLDPPPKPVKRSTRRRQDAPDLPRRPVQRRTVGRVYGHCCIEAKGVIAAHQNGEPGPQARWKTMTNRASEGLLRGF